MKHLGKAIFLSAVGLIGNVHAQATFDDWFVINANDTSGDVIAATSTDGTGKELLGFRCFAKTQECVHVLIANTACEENGEYPMLLNAASGSSMITGVCYKTSSSDQLLLKPYDSIRTLVQRGSGVLGFAIPMQSGAFKAVRFSLKGSTAATAAAERLIQERTRANPTPRKGSVTF